MPNVEEVEHELLNRAQGDPALAAAYLDLLEQDRRQKAYARYWEPCGDQLKFWEQLRPKQKIWIILGGERSGKTDACSFITTAWLLGKEWFRGESSWPWVEPLPIPEAPIKVWGVGLSDKMIKNVIWHEKLVGGLDHPPFFPQDGSLTKLSEHELYAVFRNGSRFEGMTAEAGESKFRAAAVDLVWIDEEAPRKVFDQCYQRTVSRGGKLLISATPFVDAAASPADAWLFDLVEQWQDGDPSIGVIYMSTLNNPYIPEEEKEGLRRKWVGNVEERTRLYGEFLRRGGLIYPLWKPELPLWVNPHELPHDAYRVFMLDPASSGPVGGLWAAYDRRGKMTLYKEYKEKGLEPSEHGQNILTLNGGDYLNLMLCDPYMGAQRLPWHKEHGDHRTVLQVFRDAGLSRLRLAEIDDRVALEESREYIRAAFDPTSPHPAVEVFNTLKNFRFEIERFVQDTVAQGSNRGQVRDRPRRGNDDLMACFRYLAGMRLRARDPNRLVSPVNPASGNYFSNGPISQREYAPEPWSKELW